MTTESTAANKQVEIGIQYEINEELLNKPLNDLEQNTLVATGHFGPAVFIKVWVFEHEGRKQFETVYYVNGQEEAAGESFTGQFETIGQLKQHIANAIHQFVSFEYILILEDSFFESKNPKQQYYHTEDTALAYEEGLNILAEKDCPFFGVACQPGLATVLYGIPNNKDIQHIILDGPVFEDLISRLFTESKRPVYGLKEKLEDLYFSLTLLEKYPDGGIDLDYHKERCKRLKISIRKDLEKEASENE